MRFTRLKSSSWITAVPPFPSACFRACRAASKIEGNSILQSSPGISSSKEESRFDAKIWNSALMTVIRLKRPVGCHMDSCSRGSHPLIEVPTQTSDNPRMEVLRHSENLPNRSARFCNRCALLAPHNSRNGFPSSNRTRNIAHSTPSVKTSCGERLARLPSLISKGSTRKCVCMGRG
jgi:hypothetical protein